VSATRTGVSSPDPASRPAPGLDDASFRPELIAIGASLGGLSVLEVLLAALPNPCACPMAIVQHRSGLYESRLADLLAKHSPVPVLEPEDKTRIEPGRVYLAPPDYHLLVDREMLTLSIDPPVRFARPSIDVLFESLADAYGPRGAAIVLTGSSDDGALGALAVEAQGGVVVVQAPATAESPVAPAAVLAMVPSALALALGSISELVRGWCSARPS
jgi:two-component system chemotaxis response regulator CheB